MSENKYDDMTASMKDYVATTMKELLTPALLGNAQHDAALKFRRFATQSPIPSPEMADIAKAAEIRAFIDIYRGLSPGAYNTPGIEQEMYTRFDKLRADYTESGKARYLIEHGVPEDTSDRSAEWGSSAAMVAGVTPGQRARETIETISYDVLTGAAQKKLKP